MLDGGKNVFTLLTQNRQAGPSKMSYITISPSNIHKWGQARSHHQYILIIHCERETMKGSTHLCNKALSQVPHFWHGLQHSGSSHHKITLLWHNEVQILPAAQLNACLHNPALHKGKWSSPRTTLHASTYTLQHQFSTASHQKSSDSCCEKATSICKCQCMMPQKAICAASICIQ